jgi:hypothetical protein
VHALGAEGGSNTGANSLGGSIPGLGGEADATLTVTPGESLHVFVGGKGGDTGGATGGVGGFPGGGTGGTSTLSGGGGGGSGLFGGGGGGASATNQGASAGGGGGSGFTPDGTGLTPGVQHGDGAVSITYEAAPDTCDATSVTPVTPVSPTAVTASPNFTG